MLCQTGRGMFLMIESINSILTRIPLNLVFFGCMMFGVLYSTVILVLGGHGDGGGGHGFLHDLIGGGGDGGSGGDFSGHAVHISFFSPLSVTTFMTAFGSFGLITLNAINLRPLMAIFSSCGAALLLNMIVTTVLYKIFFASQASSIPQINEIVGLEAEVITPIGASTVGEIAYNTKQGRQTSLARSVTKEPISRGDSVKIEKFVGTAAYVSRLDSSTPDKKEDAVTEKDNKEDRKS